MTEEEAILKPGFYHISVGSAATNVHFSFDISPEDPQYVEKVDALLFAQRKAELVRERLKNLKNGG